MIIHVTYRSTHVHEIWKSEDGALLEENVQTQTPNPNINLTIPKHLPDKEVYLQGAVRCSLYFTRRINCELCLFGYLLIDVWLHFIHLNLGLIIIQLPSNGQAQAKTDLKSLIITCVIAGTVCSMEMFVLYGGLFRIVSGNRVYPPNTKY